MKDKKKRNEFIDVIKAIAIILVVLGHCIQYGNGIDFLKKDLFFDDILFKIIYSFHMPLFMLISGYFYFFTVSKFSVKELVRSRITKLLGPIFVWNGLFCIVVIVYNYNMKGINIVFEIISYLKSSVLSFWFLWAIFYCSLVVMIINKFFKDNLYVYLFGFFLTFLITDYINISLYTYMYPFFVIGYLFNRFNGFFERRINFSNIFIIFSSIIIYLFLLIWYNLSSYIYKGGYCIIGKDVINQIGIDLYRFFIGLIGSGSVILLVNYLMNKRNIKLKIWFAKLGEESLGIYIISGYLIQLLSELTTVFSLNYFINIIETIVVLFCSYFLTKLIKSSKVTNVILFGGR